MKLKVCESLVDHSTYLVLLLSQELLFRGSKRIVDIVPLLPNECVRIPVPKVEKYGISYLARLMLTRRGSQPDASLGDRGRISVASACSVDTFNKTALLS